jgi:hypothetical protein
MERRCKDRKLALGKQISTPAWAILDQPNPRGNCAEMGGFIVSWRTPKIEDSRMLMHRE